MRAGFGAPTGVTGVGSVSFTRPSSPNPYPRGVNSSVCVSVLRHVPGTDGSSVGIRPCNSRSTGSENRSWSGVTGPSSAPRFGDASSIGDVPGGNQVTLVVGGSRSQPSGTALTPTVPASPNLPRLTVRAGVGRWIVFVRPPVLTATASTGRSKLTCTGAPAFTRSQRSPICALGASTLRLTVSVCPASQPTSADRRNTARATRCVPGTTGRVGRSVPSELTSTGIGVPSELRTEMLTRRPEKRGACTWGRPSALIRSDPCGSVKMVVPAVATSSTTTARSTHGQRRRLRFDRASTNISSLCSNHMRRLGQAGAAHRHAVIRVSGAGTTC